MPAGRSLTGIGQNEPMPDRALQPLRGFLLGSAASIAVGLVLQPFDSLPDAVAALALVLPVLAGAVLGGRRAAVGVALVAAATFVFAFVTPTGTFLVHTVEGFAAVAVFGAVAFVVGSLVASTTERRRDAEERRDEIERMHEQYKVLTAERERLAEEARRVEVLEEVDRQRAALLRSVSHDLRSPLVTIRGVSSELRDGTVFDDETRTQLLDLVVSETERLDRIVANLLSLSRIEAGAFRPDREPVDVAEMVERSARRLARLFRPGALRVVVAADLPLADVDATQIDQVLANLLENAARHTPAGTPVTLGAARDGAEVRITVEDQGPGLGTRGRERAMAPFVAAGPGASTGIGLAICRAIVEAHGGTLDVADRPGGGTSVSFTLPTTPD